MAKNFEEYAPQEIVTQTDTSLEPPKKISPEIKPDKNTNIPESQPTPQTENQVEQKPLLDPGEIKRANEELKRAKEELKKMWVPEDIKERKDLLEENKPTPALEPKLEIVENIGRRKTEEELAEKAKFEKDLEREKDIKEKQKRGEYLSTSDFAFKKGKENLRELSKTAEQEKKESTEKPAPEKESEKQPEEFDLSSTQIDTINVEKFPETEQKKQDKEKALEILSSPDVLNQNPKEIVESFRVLTETENGEHRHLAKEKNELAYKNLRERGCVILVGKEAIEKAKQASMAKEIERIKSAEHSMAITTFWERNPNVKEEKREEYLSNIKKKLGLDGADGDIAFDHLVNSGYLVEKAKIGWLSWFGGKEIPKIGGKVSLTFESKKDLLQEIAQEAKHKIITDARINTELKFVAGKKRVMAEKQACAKKIIEDAVEKYISQQKTPDSQNETIKQEIVQKTIAEEIKPETAPEINVEGVSSLKELYALLKENGGIIGSGGKEHSAEEVEENIEYLKKVVDGLEKSGFDKEDIKKGPLFSLVTRNGGLREKVIELLLGKKEKKPRKSSKKPENK